MYASFVPNNNNNNNKTDPELNLVKDEIKKLLLILQIN